MSCTISTEISRTGLPVLKMDGRFLASSMDPLREAQAWAERACTGLVRGESLFILGVGSGYHVLAALERGARVVVIERSEALSKAALELHPQLAKTPVIIEPEWNRLIESAQFRETACGAYRIAAHGASSQSAPEYYPAVERLLRARDPLSFLLMLKMRPELLAQLDPKALNEIPHEAVSIKTLARLFGPQSLGSRERRLWRVLEELIV